MCLLNIEWNENLNWKKLQIGISLLRQKVVLIRDVTQNL